MEESDIAQVYPAMMEFEQVVEERTSGEESELGGKSYHIGIIRENSSEKGLNLLDISRKRCGSHEFANHCNKRLLISMKASNHRAHHCACVHALEIERMPCLISKDAQEDRLRSAISLSKRMDSI